jgi:hypothetical protein
MHGPRGTKVRRAIVLCLACVGGLLAAGCGSDDDKSGLIQRASDGLIEVGAAPELMECLTQNLDERLTEADAEVAYADLSSDPEVSEKSLNRLSLAQRAVRESLVTRAAECRKRLIAHSGYTAGEVDRMLRHVGKSGYRRPALFLQG